MTTVCQICQKDLNTLELLHRHLRWSHQTPQKDYYYKFFPRKDLYTGEPIPYKSCQQYFDANFNSKDSLRLWLKNQSTDISLEYCKKILLKRKEEKGLIYTPTQVELRSLFSIPPIQFYQKFVDYYKFCEELGFKNRFRALSSQFNPLPKNSIIYVDSREQSVFPLENIQVKKLDFGDYCLRRNPEKVYVERKSMADLLGTISGGFDRFKNELERAKESYLVILVEEPLTTCLNFDRLDYIKRLGVKASPTFIFSRIRELIQQYVNIQFAFSNGKKHAAYVLERVLANPETCKNVDIQYCIDTGKL